MTQNYEPEDINSSRRYQDRVETVEARQTLKTNMPEMLEHISALSNFETLLGELAFRIRNAADAIHGPQPEGEATPSPQRDHVGFIDTCEDYIGHLHRTMNRIEADVRRLESFTGTTGDL